MSWGSSRPTPGSSPLTRGTPRCDPRRGRVRRLIPAHAGNTAGPWTSSTRPGAHPRSRGEHISAGGCVCALGGSSPLTRGTPPPLKGPAHAQRLIPAHAGNTASPPSPALWTAAHPRSRGEHLGLRAARVKLRGSSPLTRGTPFALSGRVVPAGLIPAHAGNTCRATSASRRAAAHPRSRGEHPYRTAG